MHLLEAAIIAVCLFALVAIGLRFPGRQKTMDAYFVVGRSVPGWAAGISTLSRSCQRFFAPYTLGLACRK